MLMPQRQNYNVAQTLPQRWIVSLFHSFYMDFVMATLIQCWNCNVKFITSSRYRSYVDALTLCEFCEELQMLTFHCRMVIFRKPCVEILKRLLTAWHGSGMQNRYCDIRFRSIFPSHTLKVSKSCFWKV